MPEAEMLSNTPPIAKSRPKRGKSGKSSKRTTSNGPKKVTKAPPTPCEPRT